MYTFVEHFCVFSDDQIFATKVIIMDYTAVASTRLMKDRGFVTLVTVQGEKKIQAYCLLHEMVSLTRAIKRFHKYWSCHAFECFSLYRSTDQNTDTNIRASKTAQIFLLLRNAESKSCVCLSSVRGFSLFLVYFVVLFIIYWFPQLLPPVSLMYLSGLCVHSLGTHREPLPVLEGRALQCTIILKENEIIKQTSWSIRQGPLGAGGSPVSLKVSHFFRSRSNFQVCCWYQMNPVVTMQDFLESPGMLPRNFQA